MIRVLQMVGSLNIGGSQTMLMNLYRNIDREQIQFDFVLDHPDQLYFADEVKALGGRIFTVPRFNGKNAVEVKKAWDALLTEHPEFDVFHTHVPSYASLFIPVVKRHGLKTIAHGHTATNGSGMTGLIKSVMQFPLRYQADVLMSCSDKAGRTLFGSAVKSDKYVFLPNAVDLERFAFCPEKREEYRSALGLEEKYVVGHVGRFDEPKNHGFLLEAFALLRKTKPAAHLLLVGDGPRRGMIEEKISKLDIADAVTLTGSRKDVDALLQAMDIFAFPSLWEGLPMTLVEAQAAGLPCVISDRISTDVDISPLVTRLPIDDPEIWAEELSKEHPRQDVTEDIIRSGFDIKSSVEKISKLYLTLAGEKKNA